MDPRIIERTAWRNVHGNYFSVNLNAIEEQLKEIPGVYAVAVRRVWPGALRISIIESEGLAKWSELRPDASAGCRAVCKSSARPGIGSNSGVIGSSKVSPDSVKHVPRD